MLIIGGNFTKSSQLNQSIDPFFKKMGFIGWLIILIVPMEHHTLKNVNNCFNTNVYWYLETCGGQTQNLYIIVYFFNTSVNQTSVAA